jgi:uncharacterized protein
VTEVSGYRVRGLLKNRHLQSILSSSPWRRRAGLARLRRLGVLGQAHMLSLPDGVRLAGTHYPSPNPDPRRALVLLMHGWEGSAESSYINHSTAELLNAGVDVFALNFRDHGQSHELNEGIFHSCRLQEVIDAAREVLSRFQPSRFFVAGYSLGGNFSLRLALAAGPESLPIQAAFAICPPINPSSVLRELETGLPLYHWYFMKKWRASLKRKSELFPDIHRLDDDILQRDMRGLTQWLVSQHTDWADEEQYFAGYAVADGRLARATVPIRILAAADDPVIPVADFKALTLPASARLEISPYGGHCGFIEDWRLHGFAERWLKNGVIEALNAIQ